MKNVEVKVLKVLFELTKVVQELEEIVKAAKFKEDTDNEEGCDGNCEECKAHGERPEAIMQFFDKLFGGKQ